MPPAYNSRLNPRVHKILVEACGEGMYRDKAASLAGVSRPTFNRWLREGRAESENETPYEGARYRKLYEDIAHAEAQWELETLAAIQAAGKNPAQWTALAWRLERKMPDRYGQRQQLQIESDHPLIQVNLESAETRELANRLLELVAGPKELEAGDEAAEIIGES